MYLEKIIVGYFCFLKQCYDKVQGFLRDIKQFLLISVVLE